LKAANLSTKAKFFLSQASMVFVGSTLDTNPWQSICLFFSKVSLLLTQKKKLYQALSLLVDLCLWMKYSGLSTHTHTKQSRMTPHFAIHFTCMHI